MLGNFGKKQLQILVGVHVVGFGCFHKAEEDCACFSSIIGFNDDEVLPSDSEGPYGLFGVLSIYQNNTPYASGSTQSLEKELCFRPSLNTRSSVGLS